MPSASRDLGLVPPVGVLVSGDRGECIAEKALFGVGLVWFGVRCLW